MAGLNDESLHFSLSAASKHPQKGENGPGRSRRHTPTRPRPRRESAPPDPLPHPAPPLPPARVRSGPAAHLPLVCRRFTPHTRETGCATGRLTHPRARKARSAGRADAPPPVCRRPSTDTGCLRVLAPGSRAEVNAVLRDLPALGPC